MSSVPLLQAVRSRRLRHRLHILRHLAGAALASLAGVGATRTAGAALPFGYWKRRRIAVSLVALVHLPPIVVFSAETPAASLILIAALLGWIVGVTRSRCLRGWSVRLPAEAVAHLLRLVIPLSAGTVALGSINADDNGFGTLFVLASVQFLAFSALAAQALFFRGRPASWVRILGSPSNLGAAVGTFEQCLDLLGRDGCRFAPFRADRPEPDAWRRRIGAWLERGETVLVLEPQLRAVARRMRPTGDVVYAEDCLLFTSMSRPAGPLTDAVLGALNRILALLGALTLWPLGLAIAVLILLDDGGPVIFAQQRVGRDGRLFTLYKFRTMRREVAHYDESPRGENDPRITRIGRWMRMLSLDELPQLLNVLRGEMRLVGPRPEMPFIVAGYDEKQRRRLSVMPGITGLWQVSPHRNEPIHVHIEYDLAYIAHRSPILDVALIIATLGLANRTGA